MEGYVIGIIRGNIPQRRIDMLTGKYYGHQQKIESGEIRIKLSYLLDLVKITEEPIIIGKGSYKFTIDTIDKTRHILKLLQGLKSNQVLANLLAVKQDYLARLSKKAIIYVDLLEKYSEIFDVRFEVINK